jgi:hypothetical protein
MKKRLIVTLAGLLALGAISSAANLSLTHEAKLNNHHQGSEVENDHDVVEYTLAKGYAKINEDWSFIFDVDRDYHKVDGGDNYQGWDTEFGLKRQLDSYDMFGKTWSNDIRFQMDYDSYDSVTDGNGKDSATEIYYIKYVSSTSLTERTDFEWYTELGYKTTDTDTHKAGDVTNYHNSDLRAQLDFYFITTWNKYWLSETEIYLWWLDNSDTLSADVEHYTYFTYPLYQGESTSLSFVTEFAMESYDHNWKADGEKDSTEFWIEPGLVAKYQHDENLSFHAFAGYKVYDNNMSLHHTSETHVTDNEFEAKVGFKVVM